MKIKIFQANIKERLENEINEFIACHKDNKHFNIQEIQFQHAYDRDTYLYSYSVLIVYKEES